MQHGSESMVHFKAKRIHFNTLLAILMNTAPKPNIPQILPFAHNLGQKVRRLFSIPLLPCNQC